MNGVENLFFVFVKINATEKLEHEAKGPFNNVFQKHQLPFNMLKVSGFEEVGKPLKIPRRVEKVGGKTLPKNSK